MKCAISEQVSVYCDQPEELSANDLLHLFIFNGEGYINNTYYSFDEITDLIDTEDMREAVQEHVSGQTTKIRELYINAINKLQNGA